jgi:tetratricopeptide (TPR) repeat protein
MRGAIYAEEHAFEKAEDAFEKEESLLPADFWPKYNIAELLLMQKKFAPAADAFRKLQVYREHEELVQFKAVFCSLVAGNADDAKPVLDGMKFPSDTPAYYFAQSAWAFAHKDQNQGFYWSRTGLKVFGLSRCVSFYDALAQVGWLPMRAADGSVPGNGPFASSPLTEQGDLLPQTGFPK